MGELGLTINATKTSLRNARQERFNCLGCSFGPHYPYNSKVRVHMSASPSKQSVQRLTEETDRIIRGQRKIFNIVAIGLLARDAVG